MVIIFYWSEHYSFPLVFMILKLHFLLKSPFINNNDVRKAGRKLVTVGCFLKLDVTREFQLFIRTQTVIRDIWQ